MMSEEMSMHTRSTYRRAMKEQGMKRRKRRARAVAAGAAGVLAIGIAIASQTTVAAWTDDAYLSASLGGDNTFDIALVEDPQSDNGQLVDGGVVRQAEGDGISVPIEGADLLVPGQTLTTVVGVFNNSSSLSGDLVPRVIRTAEAERDISAYLQITLIDVASGETLIDGEFIDDVGPVGTSLQLSPRGGETMLEDGVPFVAAEAGSGRVLELRVFYSETNADGAADTASLNGGKAHLRLDFDAVSR